MRRDYIHHFGTVNEYNTERTNNYYEPWVSYTDENEEVNYNKEEQTQEPEK